MEFPLNPGPSSNSKQPNKSTTEVSSAKPESSTESRPPTNISSSAESLSISGTNVNPISSSFTSLPLVGMETSINATTSLMRADPQTDESTSKQLFCSMCNPKVFFDSHEDFFKHMETTKHVYPAADGSIIEVEHKPKRVLSLETQFKVLLNAKFTDRNEHPDKYLQICTNCAVYFPTLNEMIVHQIKTGHICYTKPIPQTEEEVSSRKCVSTAVDGKSEAVASSTTVEPKKAKINLNLEPSTSSTRPPSLSSPTSRFDHELDLDDDDAPPPPRVTCNFCKKTFINNRTLDIHLNRWPGTHYTCSYCGKIFFDRDLANHLQQNHGKQPMMK